MDVIVLRTADEASRAIDLLAGAEVVGCDTETSGLDPATGRLLSIQFSDGETHVLIPLSEGIGTGPFGDLLADGSVVKIFHNARFDLAFLGASGIGVRNVFDTMLAEKVLTKGANQSVSLAETLYRYFAIDLDKSHRKKFGRGWNGVWTEDLVRYALSDVAHLPRLMEEQSDWLKKLQLEAEYRALAARSFSTL